MNNSIVNCALPEARGEKKSLYMYDMNHKKSAFEKDMMNDSDIWEKGYDLLNYVMIVL